MVWNGKSGDVDEMRAKFVLGLLTTSRGSPKIGFVKTRALTVVQIFHPFVPGGKTKPFAQNSLTLFVPSRMSLKT